MFDRLIHSDWSTNERKRFAARATRTNHGWSVSAPERIRELPGFIGEICGPGTLAGFDFPIGLPLAYGLKTGFRSFPNALVAFGEGHWASFFAPAQTADEISIYRPVYPRHSRIKGESKREHLVAALGMASLDDLRRTCERKTATRREAAPMFWTVGAAQVGKAALHGWQHVIKPARERGCRLWPFDGALADLARSTAPILAETYPGDAYGQLGIAIHPGKRSQAARAAVAETLYQWARIRHVAFSAGLAAQITDGFGPSGDGEDPFDAFVGLLAMIQVADGAPDAPPHVKCDWEGWILGQTG